MLPEQRRALWTLAAIAGVVLYVGGARWWRAHQERKTEAALARERHRESSLRLPPSVETWRNFATGMLGDVELYRAWVQKRFSCRTNGGICSVKGSDAFGSWRGTLVISHERDARAPVDGSQVANGAGAGVVEVSFSVVVEKRADLVMEAYVNLCWLARYQLTAMLLPIYGEINTSLLLDELLKHRTYRFLSENEPVVSFSSNGASCSLSVGRL